MIKKLFLGFAVLLAATSFTSCEQSEGIEPVEITVGAVDNNYVYSAEAQSVKIPVAVIPGVNYTAELVAAKDGDKVAWFRDIVFNESNTSEGDFILYLPANTTNDERKVKVVFSAENAVENAEVVLTQEGSDIPAITVVGADESGTISYNADEQVVKIPVSITPDANITVKIESIEIGDDISWLEDVIYTTTIASGSELAFLLPSYTNVAVDRSAYMIFSSEGAEDQKITFTQQLFIPTVLSVAGEVADDPTITINEYDQSLNYTSVDGNASEKAFIVSTNKPSWSAEVKPEWGTEVPNWIHIDIEEGVDGAKMVISLDKNDGISTRRGKVVFTSKEATTSIVVAQAPSPKMPTDVSVTYNIAPDYVTTYELASGATVTAATNSTDATYYYLKHNGLGGEPEWVVCEKGTDTETTHDWLQVNTEYSINFYTLSANNTGADRSVDLVLKYLGEEVYRITITDPVNRE